MDIDILRSAVTVLSMTAYVGIVVWAYVPSRRARLDRDALIPFSQHDDAIAVDGSGSIVSAAPERDPR